RRCITTVASSTSCGSALHRAKQSLPQPARASAWAVAPTGRERRVDVEGLQTDAGRCVDDGTVAERTVETDLDKRRHRHELLGRFGPIGVHPPDRALEQRDLDHIITLAKDHLGKIAVRA